jgi:hypothetical protein
LLLLLMLALVATTPNAPRSAEAPAASQESGTQQTTDDELEEFVPSEEISADKAISFPVDI